MNLHVKKSAIVLLMIMVGATACNLPAGIAPIGTSPTPDKTITALFEFITTAQAGQTSVVAPTSAPPTATVTPPPTLAAPATVAPSPTLAPTNTNTPVPTETEVSEEESTEGSSKRPGVSVIARYIQTEPTIDGVFDEDIWGQLDRYSVSSVVFGKNHWSGSDDLSATVMIGWDDYNLYIAARVKDDHYVQNASGKNLFKGDDVEIQLDTNVARDFFVHSLNGDDYQLGISPGKSSPDEDTEAYLWYPRAKASTEDSVKAAATSTADGYRIEAKIPWDIFNISPDIGKHYGFAFSVSDNDDSDENVQQSMVSNVPGRHLTDPTSWGDLTLEGKP